MRKIFSDSELQEDSVIRKFRITAADGKEYSTNHYSLEMIIARISLMRSKSTKRIILPTLNLLRADLSLQEKMGRKCMFRLPKDASYSVTAKPIAQKS